MKYGVGGTSRREQEARAAHHRAAKAGDGADALAALLHRALLQFHRPRRRDGVRAAPVLLQRAVAEGLVRRRPFGGARRRRVADGRWKRNHLVGARAPPLLPRTKAHWRQRRYRRRPDLVPAPCSVACWSSFVQTSARSAGGSWRTRALSTMQMEGPGASQERCGRGVQGESRSRQERRAHL